MNEGAGTATIVNGTTGTEMVIMMATTAFANAIMTAMIGA
jgi:hypothetical protein